MKIGMNMLLWTNHVTEKQYHIIDNLKKIGYQGVEIPLGEGNLKHYHQLGNKIKDTDLGLTAVTSLLEDTNIASTDKKIRQAGLNRLKWAIDMANAANAELICGPFHSAFASFTRLPPSKDERKWSAEMLWLAGEYAAEANIMLAPEALNRFECYLFNTMADLKNMLLEVNHPNIGAIYDTHHANIEEKSHKKGIETIGSHLKHVHISESDRGTPGKGQVNWEQVFTSLKKQQYNGWLTIEAFSTAIPEFANAINVWRNFSETKEVYTKGIELIKKQWYN